jgi:hypothetical protein
MRNGTINCSSQHSLGLTKQTKPNQNKTKQNKTKQNKTMNKKAEALQIYNVIKLLSDKRD